MVNKTAILIGSNVKRSKSKIAVIVLLFVLAAALLNIVLALVFDYRANFDRYKTTLNLSDSELIYADPANRFSEADVRALLDGEQNVADYQICEVIVGNGETDFGSGLLFKCFTFLPFGSLAERKYDLFEITEETDSVVSGAYFNYVYKAGAGYKTGDTVRVNLNGTEYHFVIKGFYNNLSTGTANCKDGAIILTDDLYAAIKPTACGGVKISIVFTDAKNIDSLVAALNEKIVQSNPALNFVVASDSMHLKTVRYTTSMIFEAVLFAAAGIVIVILLLIIAIMLSNYVKNNISALGTLKAMGYKSLALIMPFLVEFAIVAFISSTVGALASYAIFPLVNSALESQSGIPYAVRFLALPFLISVAVCLVLTVVVTYVSIRKIRKIAPINAIRNPNDASNHLNNVIPLEKTKLGLNTAMGLKTCISGVARNAIIFVCYVAVGFLLCFSAFLYENVILSTDKVIDLVCGQVPNSAITVTAENKDAMVEFLQKDGDVKDFYAYNEILISPDNFAALELYVVDDDKYMNTDLVMLEGNFPQNENEIAVNRFYANKCGISLNQNVHFRFSDASVTYKVVGLTQGAAYTGMDGYITTDGYFRMGEMSEYTYYVDLNAGVDTDAFNQKVKDNCSVVFAFDKKAFYRSVSQLYANVLTILTVVIICLSILVSSFVLFILLSLLLENKRREHGILKSLGFTTRQIILQVVICVLPFSILGTVIGLAVSKLSGGALVASMLNSIGIYRFGTSVGMKYVAVCFGFITLFTVVFTLVQSRSIKKITPHALFNKE